MEIALAAHLVMHCWSLSLEALNETILSNYFMLVL
jgi:hypothetical protein